MNERVKAFAAECGFRSDQDVYARNQAFDIPKFAELIVRECDRYVAEQYDESEPWMQPGDLLKHFGVQE